MEVCCHREGRASKGAVLLLACVESFRWVLWPAWQAPSQVRKLRAEVVIFSHALTNPRFLQSCKHSSLPICDKIVTVTSIYLLGVGGMDTSDCVHRKKKVLVFKKAPTTRRLQETTQDSKVNAEQAVHTAGGVGHVLCLGLSYILMPSLKCFSEQCSPRKRQQWPGG